MNARQLDAVVDLFEPDAVINSSAGVTVTGHEEIRSFYRDSVFASGTRLEIRAFIDDGTRCCMEIWNRGADGSSVQVADLFTVNPDGRVSLLIAYRR